MVSSRMDMLRDKPELVIVAVPLTGLYRLGVNK